MVSLCRRDSVPFPGRLTKCNMCAKKYVPELLFSTCEVPEGAAIVGRGEIVEARVCRWKKKEKGMGSGRGRLVGQSLYPIALCCHSTGRMHGAIELDMAAVEP